MVSILALLLTLAGPAAAARRSAAAAPEAPPPAVVQLPPEAELLAPGSHPVWVMDLRPPAEAETLMRQWLGALRADPEWYAAYSKAHSRPGEPLPYHPKMGMSEARYQRMLALAKQTKLTRIERAALTVTREGPTRVALHGGVALPDLTGISLDFAADRVTTPYGRLEGSRPIAVTDPESPTGPWSGRRWSLDTVDPATRQGAVVELDLGRLADGTGLLYYDAKRFVKGEVQSRAFHLLTFPATGPAAGAATGSGSASAAGAPVPPEAELLAPGNHTVWTVDIQPPAEAKALIELWLNAVRADSEWYLAYTKEHEGKQGPLPYHPKMGMSEQQYGRMVELFLQAELVRLERHGLNVTPGGPGRVVLNGGTGLPGLNGITVDFAADRVTTPYGLLEGSRTMSVSGGEPKPHWSGRVWRLDGFDERTRSGPSVVLELGRLEDGTPYLHYDAKRFADGKALDRSNIQLTFERPAP